MIVGPTRNWSPGEGGGGEGGAEGGEGGSWQSEVSFFEGNPEAAQAFSKYKTADDAWAGAYEAVKRFGAPYHLPKDGSKLTDAQRAEINASVARLNGVPETPEGYKFNVPTDAMIDDQAMADYRKLAHERGIDPKTAGDLLGLQVGLVNRLNQARATAIEQMTNQNWETFVQEDCKGDKDVAASRLEMVKRFLQGQFTRNGKIDTEGWEKFQARIMHADRVIELPLLRALHAAAQANVGTGGGSPSMGLTGRTAGALSYPEMSKK